MRVADFVGHWGQSFVSGVLVDHVGEAEAAGLTVEVVDGDVDLVDGNGGRATVVCGEIVEIATEDGPATGRCGLPVVANADGDWYACDGHTAEREQWRSMSKYEKAAWERQQEGVR